jgi:hypothetical protein
MMGGCLDGLIVPMGGGGGGGGGLFPSEGVAVGDSKFEFHLFCWGLSFLL